MNLFNSTEGYFGLFETHSLILSYNYESSSHGETARKVSDQRSNKFAKVWQNLTDSDFQILSTDVHEFDHFTQFITTPFGILLWRCYQVLIRDTMTLMNFFRERKVMLKISGRPILEWWEDEGRKQYGPFRKENESYLELFVIQEMRLLEKFLDILISPQATKTYANYTVGEFVELINDLYPRLARRSALPWLVQWRTELPPNTLIFGSETCGFNVLNIVEGMSKIRERIVLQKDQSGNARYLELWKVSLHGYYKRGYEYGVENFFPPGLQKESKEHLGHAYHNFALSLCGNIDLTCTGYLQRGLVVESEFPWFRCKVLAHPRAMIGIKEYAARTLETIQSKNELFNENSLWDTRDLRLKSSVTDEFLEVPAFFESFMNARARHFRQVEEHFFIGSSLLLQALRSLDTIGDELRDLVLIEEFTDRFYFVNTPEVPDSFLVSWMVPLHIAYQQNFMLNVMFGLKSKRPEEVGAKFLRSLQKQFPDAMAKIPLGEQKYFETLFSSELMQYWIPIEMDQFF